MIRRLGYVAAMNDDDPRQILELLKTEHRLLDEEIAQLNDTIVPDILA